MKLQLTTPAAIIVAGVIIGLSVLYGTGAFSTKSAVQVGPGSGANQVPEGNANITIRDITGDDHILGTLDAPVKIVEYSDLECPFCKRFHPTLKQAVQEYGNKVAWVYRHFPLDSIHPKTRRESEASECAAALGGNDAFWQYIDKIFEITPSNNNLDPAELPKIAGQIGLDVNKFNTCLNSGKYASKIQADLDDAIRAGGQGTPFTVIVIASGKKFPISGALPYENVKSVIDQALTQK